MVSVTYSRELFKADVAVAVFIELLEEFPDLIPRHRKAHLVEEVTQFGGTDVPITIHILRVQSGTQGRG